MKWTHYPTAYKYICPFADSITIPASKLSSEPSFHPLFLKFVKKQNQRIIKKNIGKLTALGEHKY